MQKHKTFPFQRQQSYFHDFGPQIQWDLTQLGTCCRAIEMLLTSYPYGVGITNLALKQENHRK